MSKHNIGTNIRKKRAAVNIFVLILLFILLLIYFFLYADEPFVVPGVTVRNIFTSMFAIFS